jgi:hypothetical protein
MMGHQLLAEHLGGIITSGRIVFWHGRRARKNGPSVHVRDSIESFQFCGRFDPALRPEGRWVLAARDETLTEVFELIHLSFGNFPVGVNGNGSILHRHCHILLEPS